MSPPAHAGEGPWYADGLRFTCTLCGNCCTGPAGFVKFSEAEGRAIARRLSISYAEFWERYTHDTPEGRSLTEVEVTPGVFDCVFLDRQTLPGKAVCSLYEDRPTQCRTFPWWPEHLRSERAWKTLAHSCEGVDLGDAVVPLQQITVERDRQRRADLAPPPRPPSA